MGIEQIQMNQTKALPPVPQFNWSQMESSYAKSHGLLVAWPQTCPESDGDGYRFPAVFFRRLTRRWQPVFTFCPQTALFVAQGEPLRN